MFVFPTQTAFGKAIPKSRVYTHAAPTRRVRDLFVSQVEEIVWAHKLSPETLRIPEAPGVPEIEVFDLILKGETLDDDVLHAIDRAIPFPLFHRLRKRSGSETLVAWSAAYKRPSEADAAQWVVGARFTSAFTPESASGVSPLPAALDLGRLYATLFAPLLPLPPRPGETLGRHIERCEAFSRLRRQIDQLTARLHRERQFNRKVELNRQLKPLQAELEALQSG